MEQREQLERKLQLEKKVRLTFGANISDNAPDGKSVLLNTYTNNSHRVGSVMYNLYKD